MKFKLFCTLTLVGIFYFNTAGGFTIKEGNGDHFGVRNAVRIELLNEAKLDSLISTRTGNFLFINMGAPWCVPCREEFKDLIQLADFYEDKKVEVVAISVDYPDEIESKIKPFIESQKVNFKIYVQDFDRQENLINKLNTEWNGALPASFLYNHQGKQVAYLPGKHSFNEFKKIIDSLY